MTAAPELSRPVALADIGAAGLRLEIVADGGERAALARRFALAALDRLEAEARLDWLRRGRRLRLRLRLRAEVSQVCVVSLEPVPQILDKTIELVFARPEEATPSVTVVIESPDEAEPLTGEALDLGEIVAGELALALDPYPRREDATIEDLEAEPGAAGDDDAEGVESPFAVLAARRPNR